MKTFISSFLISFLACLFLLVLWRFAGHLNSTQYCISCHSMKFANDEYKESRHYMSRSGMRAGCSDCHVGKGLRRALVLNQIIPDLWAELRSPITDKAEWDRRRSSLADKARRSIGNGCRSCASCHDLETMKPAKERGRVAHRRIKIDGLGCLECHKDLAHAEAVR